MTKCLYSTVFIQTPSCWYSNWSSERADSKNHTLDLSRMLCFQDICLFWKKHDNAKIIFFYPKPWIILCFEYRLLLFLPYSDSPRSELQNEGQQHRFSISLSWVISIWRILSVDYFWFIVHILKNSYTLVIKSGIFGFSTLRAFI